MTVRIGRFFPVTLIRLKDTNASTRWSLVVMAILAVIILIGDRWSMSVRQSNAGGNRAELLDKESDTYHKARSLLPISFAEYDTARFIVLSNADAHWTRSHADHLERTHHQFMRFVNRLGLQPQVLRHKLVCIVFAKQADFLDFASLHDSVDDPWVTGYYSPRHDWVAFYNPGTSPAIDEARREIGDMRGEIDSLAAEARMATRNGNLDNAYILNQELLQSRQHVSKQERLVDAFARTEGIATTTHEATHMLMYHTDVQSRLVRYPLWVSEGLATCFETGTPNQAFGPDHDFEPRRERFREIVAESKLLPLDDLIALDRVDGLDEATIDVIYHQSYALMGWLTRFRKDQLRRYLETMTLQPAGELTAERHSTVFEAAFGDATALERAWLRYEQRHLAGR